MKYEESYHRLGDRIAVVCVIYEQELQASVNSFLR